MSVNSCISTRRQTCKYIHEIMFMVHCAAVKMVCKAEKTADACYKEIIYLPKDAELKESLAIAEGRKRHRPP